MNKMNRLLLLGIIFIGAVVSDSSGMGWLKPRPPVETNAPPVVTPPVVPQSGTVTLLTLKVSSKEYFIDFTYTDNSHWPSVKESNGKYLNGWILVNGKKAEQFRPGYTSQHLKNVYGSGSYGQKYIKNGDTVRISLQSRDAKETTNELTFIWPWKDTSQSLSAVEISEMEIINE